MWNALPAHLKSPPNVNTFERELREHIRIEMDRRGNDIFIYGYMGKTKNWGNFVASKMAVR